MITGHTGRTGSLGQISGAYIVNVRVWLLHINRYDKSQGPLRSSQKRGFMQVRES